MEREELKAKLTEIIPTTVFDETGRPVNRKTGIDIFTRLMGLILAAIAVEFVASGVRGLFPVLG